MTGIGEWETANRETEPIPGAGISGVTFCATVRHGLSLSVSHSAAGSGVWEGGRDGRMFIGQEDPQETLSCPSLYRTVLVRCEGEVTVQSGTSQNSPPRALPHVCSFDRVPFVPTTSAIHQFGSLSLAQTHSPDGTARSSSAACRWFSQRQIRPRRRSGVSGVVHSKASRSDIGGAPGTSSISCLFPLSTRHNCMTPQDGTATQTLPHPTKEAADSPFDRPPRCSSPTRSSATDARLL